MAAEQIVSADFEVFGRVQGVFFRKYTVQTGKQLGLRGWCSNTKHGTVLGHMEGSEEAVNQMKHWLTTVGSPSSKIEKAEFRNEKTLTKFTIEYSDFKVHR
ncbi:acylphosphatase-2-like [Neocloeon triangulifer]|uniref:acylphosphatase-2-like n=1 Tax=Neocloeon triangulifer TaxID=2078957 RepID=UPI00286EF7CD|nr:acylphosphatase-2-like [Neocloeon triangulifer]